MLTLSAGCIIATPTLMQLLSSCKTEKGEKWAPKFLSTKDLFVVSLLSDLILPTSKTMGALDVQTPQFIDTILHEVISKKEQNKFRKGASIFNKTFKKIYKKEISEGKKEDFLTLLNTYFKISAKKQAAIFDLLESDSPPLENQDTYFIYSYLLFVRHYTLFGYYTSEEVGTQILTYDPSPGFYNGCVPVEEAGNIPSA